MLLAEPEALPRTVWQQAFARAGFAVLPAADEAELDRMLHRGSVGIVVADRRMVGPAGERVRHVREILAGRPLCIVLATVRNEADRDLLLGAGADWYIDKIALASHLPTVLRAILRSNPRMPAPEFRVAPRAVVALPIAYYHGNYQSLAKALNVSETGIFIKTTSPAEIGTLLLLSFALPDGRRLECFARVVRHQQAGGADGLPPGMGLQFVALTPWARAVLADFASERQEALPVS